MAKVREMIADILIEAGIDHVFGMPGGATPFLYDALFDRKDKIRAVLARHEGGASCMADMYGRLTGKPGVVICQGPWAGSNAALGVMESYLAGSPMVVIADLSDYAGLIQHAPYQCCGGEYGSIDLPAIMRGMTKYTTVANTPEEFLHGLQFAIKHATTGKPGPAAVLARWNMIVADIDLEKARPLIHPTQGYLNTSPACISNADAQKIVKLLLEASNPVMICGRGVHCTRAYGEVQELAELIGIPVATSYMGKSTIPETHDFALGVMGNIGQKIANEKIISADLILAVGTGLAPENTRMMANDYIRPAEQKIIQIDIEPLNAGFTYPVLMGAASDAKLALRMVIDVIKAKGVKIDVAKKAAEMKKQKQELGFFSTKEFSSDASPIMPERVVKDVTDLVGDDNLLVFDGGNNRMWFTKYWQTKKPGQFIAPGGVAAVGWGVPAALCAQMIRKDRKVIGVSGDGGMMMGLYCLEMARHYQLPITYLVLNNSCLGNVRDFQPPARRIATDYPEADFAGIARGVGIDSFKVDKAEDVKPALNEALSSNKPSLVEVRVDDAPHFRLIGT